MKRACRPFRDRLIEMAEGHALPAVAEHVAGCADCAAIVGDYTRMLGAARIPWSAAPAALIDRVKALMPERRRVVFGRRLGTFATAARGEADEFQVVVGEGDLSVRLMATRDADGWRVMGRAPAGTWNFEGPSDAAMESGRFEFRTSSLEDSAFSLTNDDTVFQVPALSHLLQDAPPEPHAP